MVLKLFFERLFKMKSSLSLGVGLLAFTVVAGVFIYSGLPIKTAMELGAASALGAGSFMEFIDAWIGISDSLRRRQETRSWQTLDDNLRSGRIGSLETLRVLVRRQLSKELSEVPWYHFFERSRIKENANSRHWAIKHILPHTLPQSQVSSLGELCNYLYEAEKAVAQYQDSKALPSRPEHLETFVQKVLGAHPPHW
jgi:hypothetical protein